MDNTIPENCPHKQCPKCKEWFPATPEYFHRNKMQRSGLTPRCKTCSSTATRPKDIIPEGHKRCTKCKEIYPATTDFFHVRTDRPSGIRAECIACGKTRARIFAQQHSEQHRKNSRRNYWKDPELSRARSREQHHKHRGRRIAQKHQHYKTHRTQILMYARWYKTAHPEQAPNWRKRNPLKMKAYSHKYRAQKKAITGTHSSAQLHEQLKRQHYRCYYAACGHAKFEKRGSQYVFHVEHTFPVSRIAGTDIPANDMGYIVLACPSCNHQKSNKYPWEWPEGGRLL